MHKRFFILATAFFILFSTTFAHAQTLPDFKDLAKKSGPAVVNISTEKMVTRNQNIPPFMRNMPKGTPFDDFFKQFGMPPFEQFPTPKPRKENSLGSGFIISADGYIVTNNHVVEDATSITVNLQSATNKPTPIKAKVIGSDADTDLALLKIEHDGALPFLEFGDSDAIEVGEWVIAIGNPFGLDHSVTKGIISAKGRNIQSGPFDSFLQTDASINPGNSGGPLIDLQGKVIGINTAIIASGQGIGFAIPSNMAADIISQLKDHKMVKRGWLGAQIQPVDDATAAALGMPAPIGALVGEVFPDEPAAIAGIKAGDVIIKINNNDVLDNSDLLHKVAALKPNTKIPVVVWRDGKEKELTLTLGTRDNNLSASSNEPGDSKPQGSKMDILGMNVRPVSKEEAAALGYDSQDGASGLIVLGLEQDKPAATADIKEGDILISANLKPLAKSEDLQKIIKDDAKEKGAIMFKIARQNKQFFISVPLK